MKGRKLTFTNIFIILCFIIYILNVFVISPETGYMTKIMSDLEKERGIEQTSESNLIYKIIGTWGGNVNENLGYNVTNFLHGEIWRPFTSLLTHAHIMHLIMNMLTLYIVGNKIEHKYGTFKTLSIFIVAGAITNILGAFTYFNLLGNQESIVLGASSGILVLMGILVTICLNDKSYLKTNLKKKETIYLIFYFVFTTILTGLFTCVDHMIGLILGIIIGTFIHYRMNKIQAKVLK